MNPSGKHNFRQRMQEKLAPAILQILRNEDLPAQERLEGVILLMSAHGLSLEPERENTIRKRFADCVADQQKKRSRKKT